MIELSNDLVIKLLATVDQGLVRGMGEPVPGQMCVEAAICYALGEGHSDKPSCVEPTVRSCKIALNDMSWSSDMARAKGMRKVAIAQLGSLGVVDAAQFAQRLATLTIQLIVPIALRAAAAEQNEPHKSQLEDAAQACEQNPTQKTADAADAAASATASTAAHAAARAASAADAAAYAAADAAAYAADAAAYAAAYAADAAAYTDEILTVFADMILEVLIELESPGCEYLFLCEENS